MPPRKRSAAQKEERNRQDRAARLAGTFKKPRRSQAQRERRNHLGQQKSKREGKKFAARWTTEGA